jgi:beta-galactosidase
MRQIKICISLLFLIFSISILSAQTFKDKTPTQREHLLMDSGWRFALGNACDTEKDFDHGSAYFSYFAKAGYGDGPAAKNFDDRGWRILDLPHDWAAELPFDSTASYSHGFKIVGRNFPETSIGWYRRTFFIPDADLGKRISIEFDGVHRNSTVWVNGFYLGQEHCGYYGFQYDITDYLNYGGDNVVAVRVDATMEEGWYYEGAGIYRHVWLNKTAPLHIAWYGTFVSADVKEHSAGLTARATIVNERNAATTFDIDQTILDASGKTVATAGLKQLTLTPDDAREYSCLIQITNPNLWSVENPYRYKLVTTLISGGAMVDRYETPFGIRTVRFDSQQGFFLNGKHVLLQGTNNHQDHAGVGTAIPDALQEFRVRRLKEMGANAYRCSHNPPTPELLDICDRLGMLVIDENRLMGINAEHLDLLKRMILRDRNHPSVVIWSLGNEEWAMEGNITGARVAATMQDFVRRLDPTRRITYANSGGWGHGISTVQDVMGFNYIFNGNIDQQHTQFPNQPAIGTEETTSRSTRGIYEDDPTRAHMAATDRTPGGRSMEEGFKFYAARPFLSGLFFWTGFDYRGEPHPFGWPQVSSQSGIVDLCGFPKDMFYYLKSRWSAEPVLHLFPHWNWPGREGQPVAVWAYSNCDEVELFLNGKSLGRKSMPENSHIEWLVNYEPGTLLGRGYTDGKEIISTRVETTAEPAAVQLIADRPAIRADGEEVAVITVQVNDARGRMVPTADNQITFKLNGPGKIIGVGNGDPSSHEPDRYFENVILISISGLKMQLVPDKGKYPEVTFDYDDSAWPVFIQSGEIGNQNSDKKNVIRGSFQLPAITDSTRITLLAKSIDEQQAIYVNGNLIAGDIRRDDPNQKYVLDHAILRPGKNVYVVVGKPFVKRTQWENLNADPGLLQVYTPAPPWQRRVFNGLAQVIVQSGREPGELILTAAAGGLATGVLKIKSEPAVIRPSVP